MMIKKIVTLTIVFALSLTGCVSSNTNINSENTYYVLDSGAVINSNQKSGVNVKLAKIIVADYLDQPNLITRQGEQKILLARYHHWAEGLPDLIYRALKTELNVHSSTNLFVEKCDLPCQEIEVSVEHFYPTDKGEVVFSGDYSVSSSSKYLETKIPFLFKTKLKSDGYAQSVKQLGEQIEQLAHDINTRINN